MKRAESFCRAHPAELTQPGGSHRDPCLSETVSRHPLPRTEATISHPKWLLLYAIQLVLHQLTQIASSTSLPGSRLQRYLPLSLLLAPRPLVRLLGSLYSLARIFNESYPRAGEPT